MKDDTGLLLLLAIGIGGYLYVKNQAKLVNPNSGTYLSDPLTGARSIPLGATTVRKGTTLIYGYYNDANGHPQCCRWEETSIGKNIPPMPQ